MQRVAIIILLLAVAGGVYFLVSKDEPQPEEPTPVDVQPQPAKKDDPGLDPLKAKGPKPSPIPQELQLRSPARALVLGHNRDSWTETVLMMCKPIRELSFGSWFLNAGDGGAAGASRGMTALADKPTASYLGDEDVTVLVLDSIDPNALPKAFWEAVSSRVVSGRMGLFVRPNYPTGADGKALSEHPMLSHPVLGPLLPIKKATLLEGTPTPGVFAAYQPIKPTAEGLRHPATRLISDPEVSAQAWSVATQGKWPLATKFCYPVEDIAADAQILLNCEAAATLPAVIASAPTARSRVLWMGNVDFSREAHFMAAKDRAQKVMINHALIWLVGQAQP